MCCLRNIYNNLEIWFNANLVFNCEMLRSTRTQRQKHIYVYIIHVYIRNIYIYIYIYTKIKKPKTRCVRVNIK